jgi:hypothetical protein
VNVLAGRKLCAELLYTSSIYQLWKLIRLTAYLTDQFADRDVGLGSTPVIENSEPNFRKGSKSAIRRLQANDRSCAGFSEVLAIPDRKDVHYDSLG